VPEQPRAIGVKLKARKIAATTGDDLRPIPRTFFISDV
jgi:hypothetical protein